MLFISFLKVIAGSSRAYHALLTSCLEQGKLAICRMIPRQTAGPTFVALLPQEEKKLPAGTTFPAGFYVIQLPYADDMRDLTLPRTAMQPDEVSIGQRRGISFAVGKSSACRHCLCPCVSYFAFSHTRAYTHTHPHALNPSSPCLCISLSAGMREHLFPATDTKQCP